LFDKRLPHGKVAYRTNSRFVSVFIYGCLVLVQNKLRHIKALARDLPVIAGAIHRKWLFSVSFVDSTRKDAGPLFVQKKTGNNTENAAKTRNRFFRTSWFFSFSLLEITVKKNKGLALDAIRQSTLARTI
jgi:hypothetical protein